MHGTWALRSSTLTSPSSGSGTRPSSATASRNCLVHLLRRNSITPELKPAPGRCLSATYTQTCPPWHLPAPAGVCYTMRSGRAKHIRMDMNK